MNPHTPSRFPPATSSNEDPYRRPKPTPFPSVSETYPQYTTSVARKTNESNTYDPQTGYRAPSDHQPPSTTTRVTKSGDFNCSNSQHAMPPSGPDGHLRSESNTYDTQAGYRPPSDHQPPSTTARAAKSGDFNRQHNMPPSGDLNRSNPQYNMPPPGSAGLRHPAYPASPPIKSEAPRTGPPSHYPSRSGFPVQHPVPMIQQISSPFPLLPAATDAPQRNNNLTKITEQNPPDASSSERVVAGSELRSSSPNDPSSGMKGKLTNFFKRSEKTGRNPPSQEGDESRRGFFRGRNQSRAISVSTEELSEEDVIIAVMGPTGSGKSSFINMATGNDKGVGHDLESCTTEISIVKFHCPERSDLDVLFVDTPGFDDTNKSDVEILNMIAEWLKTTYARHIKLAGILYFHRISDNRMAGSPLKNLRMFEKLCGKNALKNIILTTTMWDEVDDLTGTQRERELKGKYWRAMIDQGSKTVRYHNTPESVWEIIDDFLQTANKRYAVLLQQEMVDMERQLRETKAGQALFATLEVLVEKQQEMLFKIRQETKRHADDAVLAALKDEYEDLRKQLTVTVAEMQTLKISLGKRFLRVLRRPWDLWEGDNMDGDNSRSLMRMRFMRSPPWGK